MAGYGYCPTECDPDEFGPSGREGNNAYAEVHFGPEQDNGVALSAGHQETYRPSQNHPEIISTSNFVRKVSKFSSNYSNMSKRPTLDHQPSSLVKMVEGSGRTRGSSATPVPTGPAMLSPQPQRDLQTHIDNMSNDMHQASLNQEKSNRHTNRGRPQPQNQGGRVGHQRDQSTSTRSVASTQEQGVRIGHSARASSSYSYQPSPSQDMGYGNVNTVPGAFQFPSRQGGPSHAPSRRMTVNDLSAKFQAKLTELQHMISKATDIPPNVQETLTQEIRKIAQQFNDSQRSLGKEFERVRNERDDLRRLLQSTREERKTLELKHQKSMERVNEIESQWKIIQEELLYQISRQKEQIEGKRALWMDANPGSSARRDAMNALRDPFQSPSTHHTPSYMGGAMSSMTSPSTMSQSQNAFFPSHPTAMGPHPYYASGEFNKSLAKAGYNAGMNVGSSSRDHAHLERRRGTLPTGGPLPAPAPFPGPFSIYGTNRTFITEPRTPPPSNALVLHQTEEELAVEYKGAIGKLYDLVEAWVRNFSSVPNQNNDRAIASSNDILWDYMMNCTYPGHRQDSHTHVVALLNDANTRFWFVMRMATQYCVKDIMSIKAFRPYSKKVERIINEVLEKLQERGLNNDSRQQYIDKGSKAVQSVIQARDYSEFRAKQLGVHTKALRDMLGPLLNDGVPRAQAGTDLGAIAVHAWELSCKMHTARLTFQIYFPETASKFTAATMKTKDQVGVDPMRLQIEQARLKLVITPVITMRDDRGTTIKAKSLHSSNVLLMK